MTKEVLLQYSRGNIILKMTNELNFNQFISKVNDLFDNRHLSKINGCNIGLCSIS